MAIVKLLIGIALVVGAIYVIVLVINCIYTNHLLLDYFKQSSVIVYGPKGSGKDLLFQKVIYLKRKKPYLANIPYGYNCIETPPKMLSVSPNTFQDFIKGKVKVIPKNDSFEGLDYYFSDIGVFLPCQYGGYLNKEYPSLPIYYALSRHLYLQNIHCNSQNLNRAWNMIREQADRFIRCVKKTKLLFGMVCTIRMYDKYESANANLLPMNTSIFSNKYEKALQEQYKATNGEILVRKYYIRYKDIKYDTRVFHKYVFGETAKEWEKRINSNN